MARRQRMMNIKIGSNTEYLEITEIVSEEAGYAEFFHGTLNLKVSGVKTEIRVSFMIGEIEELKTNLEKLYRTLKFKFEFRNLEDNVALKISPTPQGQIKIDGRLRNEDYSATVDFRMETDQTFLPDSIKQIKDTLNFLKSTSKK